MPLIEEELRRFQEDTGCKTTFDADYQARPCQEIEVAFTGFFTRHSSTSGDTLLPLGTLPLPLHPVTTPSAFRSGMTALVST